MQTDLNITFHCVMKRNAYDYPSKCITGTDGILKYYFYHFSGIIKV